jgi:hypothetical protein
MGKFFSHLRNVQTGSVAYPASYAVGTGILTLADMKLTSAEVKNEWSYTSNPHTYLHVWKMKTLLFIRGGKLID